MITVNRSRPIRDPLLHSTTRTSWSSPGDRSSSRSTIGCGRPMDIEWGKDGHHRRNTPCRPGRTVQSRAGPADPAAVHAPPPSAIVRARPERRPPRSARGRPESSVAWREMPRVQPGDVLVADMTDPDWEPVMKRAAAVVTNRGGRTCHAAIIARELGIPAVVGCGNATAVIRDGAPVTVPAPRATRDMSTKGRLDFEQTNRTRLPADGAVKIMMNVGNPDRAFRLRRHPNRGVGLARLEFIVNRMIGVHPRALLEFERSTPDLDAHPCDKWRVIETPSEFYRRADWRRHRHDRRRLRTGTGHRATCPTSRPNEYANLIGGHLYEPDEENPMLGFHGASRYVDACLPAVLRPRVPGDEKGA